MLSKITGPAHQNEEIEAIYYNQTSHGDLAYRISIYLNHR